MFFDLVSNFFKDLYSENSQIDSEREVGEWVHNLINENIHIESHGVFFEKVQKIATQLNGSRKNLTPIEPVILWIPQVNAFITPGYYLYISRELLQLLKNDDSIAFLIAHEIGHYDLGHTQIYHSYLSTLRHIPAGDVIGLLLLKARSTLFSQDREMEADRYALELCLNAGYDGYRCLEFFDFMEAHYLDFRNFDEVFRSEENSDDDSNPFAQVLNPILKQIEYHTHSHPDIHHRKQYLLEQLSRC
jgi:predicted Zn-dependent protease